MRRATCGDGCTTGMVDNGAIRVVGAGPAGLAAAITLARAGRQVVVYEKNADVGMRFHNDYQGIENWSAETDTLDFLRSISLEPHSLCIPFHRGMLMSPKECAEVTSPTPFFYLVKRGTDPDSLDMALKERAVASGVTLRFNSPVPHQEGDIVATGYTKPDVLAFGMVFDTDADDRAVILFDDRLAPKGYAYLLVCGGRATLATTLFAEFSSGRMYLEKAAERLRSVLHFTIENARTFVGCGSFSIPKSAVREGRRYAGEAAGFQDYLFGFGLRYALTSGHLAAQSVVRNLDYDSLWKAQFGQQLEASRRNRTIFRYLGNRGYDLLVKTTSSHHDPRGLWRRFYSERLRLF